MGFLNPVWYQQWGFWSLQNSKANSCHRRSFWYNYSSPGSILGAEWNEAAYGEDVLDGHRFYLLLDYRWLEQVFWHKAFELYWYLSVTMTSFFVVFLFSFVVFISPPFNCIIPLKNGGKWEICMLWSLFNLRFSLYNAQVIMLTLFLTTSSFTFTTNLDFSLLFLIFI